MTDENENEQVVAADPNDPFFRRLSEKMAELNYETENYDKLIKERGPDIDFGSPHINDVKRRDRATERYSAMSRDELLAMTRLSLDDAADDFEVNMPEVFIKITAKADQETENQDREAYLLKEFLSLQYLPPQHLATLHIEMATYLAGGGKLPDEYIIWFAKNVIDPSRLKRARGRNSKKRLHGKLCDRISFLNTFAGLTIKEAQELVLECYAISESHLRDIWNSPENRSQKNNRSYKYGARKSAALRASIAADSKKSV